MNSEMKTITMDFSEYEQMDGERKKANEELAEYKNAIEIVYGKEVAGSILSMADEVRDSRSRMQISKAVFGGTL